MGSQSLRYDALQAWCVFVQAEVNGTRGKMMFDTGTPEALVINDHLLKELGPGKIRGTASVGSGQTYTKTIRDCVHGVSIGGSRATSIPLVESSDLGFIEKSITPDFLGFVGFGSYPGYAFELDYVRRRLVLEKSMPGKRLTLLSGEQVLGALKFTTRRRPNDPFIKVKIGGRPFIGALDTGQSGSLEMSGAELDALIQSGALVPLPGKDDDGNVLYRAVDLELAPRIHISLPAITVRPTGSIADKGFGITEPAAIYLGYQVLAQLKTVWDWPNRTLYLLIRQKVSVVYHINCRSFSRYLSHFTPAPLHRAWFKGDVNAS